MIQVFNVLFERQPQANPKIDLFIEEYFVFSGDLKKMKLIIQLAIPIEIEVLDRVEMPLYRVKSISQNGISLTDYRNEPDSTAFSKVEKKSSRLFIPMNNICSLHLEPQSDKEKVFSQSLSDCQVTPSLMINGIENEHLVIEFAQFIHFKLLEHDGLQSIKSVLNILLKNNKLSIVEVAEVEKKLISQKNQP